MKTIRAVAVLLIITIFMGSLCGCGEDYKDSYIYFELSEVPQTLDAQTASSDSELLIVRNIFEGLLRKDKNGEIVCGATESYEKNGLTYTFKLRDDAVWSTEDPVTANDFVFAFKRAVLPDTKAPFVNRLFPVANAKAIYEGKADVSSLGVTAPDEKTVVITLEYDDPDFEETLTSSVCMPCNEEFFDECVGKYGLESKYIISNSSYSLTKWAKDNFGIRLYRNKKYKGGFEASNAAVFISCNDEKTPLALLKNDNVDLSFIDCTELEDAKADGFGIIEYENICWVLTVSKEYSADIRSCFAAAFSGEVYSSSLQAGFKSASSLYPDILEISGNADGAGLSPYDINTAKSKFSAIVSKMENKRFPSATLYYYDAPGIKQPVTAIVGHWQQNLSAFINIQPSDSLSALQSELSASSLSFAVFPIYARSTELSEYLRTFGIDSVSPDAAAEQTKLFGSNALLPIAFQNTFIAYRSAIKEIYHEGTNGYIDFSFVIKEE